MSIIDNYNSVVKSIRLYSSKTSLVVATKNQDTEIVKSLIKCGHLNFGENRVQEAISKWKNLISTNSQLKLHLIGKLQSNKAKDAFQIFHYMHTLDNDKLAQIFSKLESNSSKKIKYFIQVNIGNEPQKNGISVDKLNQFAKYCIKDLKLTIIGLMCIPPIEINPSKYFIKLADLAKKNNLNELSMGMSNDYVYAIKNGATFVRVGSKIFNKD